MIQYPALITYDPETKRFYIEADLTGNEVMRWILDDIKKEKEEEKRESTKEG